MRVKDKYAGNGLYAYAMAALLDDPEYANEMLEMSARAGMNSAIMQGSRLMPPHRKIHKPVAVPEVRPGWRDRRHRRSVQHPLYPARWPGSQDRPYRADAERVLQDRKADIQRTVLASARLFVSVTPLSRNQLPKRQLSISIKRIWSQRFGLPTGKIDSVF